MAGSDQKLAIVCYSRTGHARTLARRLARERDADLFFLETDRYRMPVLGYWRAGFDSLRGAIAPLHHPLPDVRHHAAVVICGPVWTSCPAVPLLTYLREEIHLPFALGLLLSCGEQSPDERAFRKAEEILHRVFVAKLAIPEGMEDHPDTRAKLTAFAGAIDAAMTD